MKTRKVFGFYTYAATLGDTPRPTKGLVSKRFVDKGVQNTTSKGQGRLYGRMG